MIFRNLRAILIKYANNLAELIRSSFLPSLEEKQLIAHGKNRLRYGTEIATFVFLLFTQPSFAETTESNLRRPSGEEIINAIFPGALIKDCTSVDAVSAEECENRKNSLAFMAERLWKAKNFLTIDAEKTAYRSFKSYIPNNVEKYSPDDLGEYYKEEAATYAECLKNECGERLKSIVVFEQPLATRWTSTYEAASCVFDTWNKEKARNLAKLQHPSAMYREFLPKAKVSNCGRLINEQNTSFLLWRFQTFPPYSVKF